MSPVAARKRTTSFSLSSERPTKSQKTTSAMPLRRTESLLFLPAFSPTPTAPSDQLTVTKPNKRKAPPQIILPSHSSPIITLLTPRSSSPLSAKPVPRPGRPVFPRSKPEPDLYRAAIKKRMRNSPEGQSILSLGPRLAMDVLHTTHDIWAVTRDFERFLEEDLPHHDDPPSPPPPVLATTTTTTASWVLVKGAAGGTSEDWEMVDCAA